MLNITYRLSHDNVRKRDNVCIYVQITNPGSVDVYIEKLELATISNAFFLPNSGKPQNISTKMVHDKVNMFVAPGSTHVEIFEIKIDGMFPYLVPRAETYRLGCVVHYDEKSTPPKKSQQVGFIEMNIRAPFSAIATGAIVGSILGTIITKSPPSFDWTPANAPAFLAAMVLNMILAFVAVVVLQRKKDVQSFITIEDVWGGLTIGFVVAYGGVQFFRTLLPSLGGGEGSDGGGGSPTPTPLPTPTPGFGG